MKILGTIEGKNKVKNYFAYDANKDELRLSRKNFPLKKYGVNDYTSVIIYQDYNDYYTDFYDSSTYLEHFLTQIEKSKATLTIEGFEFTDKEKQLGINYIKNSYPVSYEFIQDEITTDNFDNMIECEYGDNFEYALEVCNGYVEGYTGIYGNNDLYELLDNFVEVRIQELFYENEKFTTEYIKACLENDFSTPEFEILYFDYDITNYIDKDKYNKFKEYYGIKNKIERELWWIGETQKELLDLKHGKSTYSEEFTQELIQRNLRSIQKTQENIREYKRDLERLNKEV